MPWITGQRLQGGKYVIDIVLGQGGFGITYKALHIELNRTVVIKTPNEHLSDDQEYDKYIERFIQEGRTLARLSQDHHPHIVGVIDLFKEGAIHCLVMDFVPGENLFQVVRRRGALPEVEIVPCIRQIGEALVVVHQAGLVHRDAHPGNIMVRSNGKAVLIDFGIAKELLPKTLSSTGNAGNHGFAPYEQMTRGSREPTVDVYCLAATLYYAVTGQNPTTSLARRLHDVFLTPPKQIISGISDQLNQAILKGMALEAKDRPQSMQVWLAMLEAPKATPPLTVEPVHRTEFIRPNTNSQSDATPNNQVTTPTKTIPWGWLTVSLLLYVLMGYLLVSSKISPLNVAVAWAVSGVWAIAVSRVRDAAMAMARARALNLALAFVLVVALTFVLLVALPLTVPVALALPIVLAGHELRKSFSKVDTFVILASTSSLGLGLGWLGHRIFNTGS
jgi:serine/threonine protein kinase